MTDPHILGHESAGVVIAVHLLLRISKSANGFAIGPSIICNECEKVLFLSTPSVPGFLRRYVNHPAIWCHKIGSMSFEDGALLERLSVAIAGMQRSGIKLGDLVLICG